MAIRSLASASVSALPPLIGFDRTCHAGGCVSASLSWSPRPAQANQMSPQLNESSMVRNIGRSIQIHGRLERLDFTYGLMYPAA